MPRVRTVTAPDGFVHFSKGTPDDFIKEFAMFNKIGQVVLDTTTNPNEILLKVPTTTPEGIECAYEIHDEFYVWVNFPPTAVKAHVLR